MRWLVLMLVLGNLGLWWLFSGPDDVERDADASGRLPRVSELQTVPPPSAGEGDVEAPEPTPESAHSGTGTANEASEVAIADVPGESRQESGPVTEADPALAEIPIPEPKPVQRYCFRLGWFDSEEAALALAGDLGAVAISEPEVEAQEFEQPPLHWVIIPPRSSRDAALELFRDVQRRGVDSYLVTRGEMENAISLGLFESRESAERVLEKRISENLPAVLELFPRNQIRYALAFEAAYSSGSQELDQARAYYGHQFELVEINGCEGVATTKKSP